MKSFLFLLAALLLAQPAFALNKSVTVATTAAVLVTPGSHVKVIVIQNPTGSTGSIVVSLDGTVPTATTGILIPAGQQLILTYSGAGGGGGPNIIYAIAVTGNTTIKVSTDDSQSA